MPERTAIVVTHGPFCLDGMAAAVCLGRLYGKSRAMPIFTHPSDVDRVIEEVARRSARPQDLWITDITWKQSKTEQHLSELARKGWRVFWVDHHTIALEKDENAIAALGLAGWVASDRFSAAKLLYDYLIASAKLFGTIPARVKEFKNAVLLADDNDRWLHRRRGSRDLAMTVAALGGMEAYRELMKIGGDLRFSPRMEQAYRTASRELAESVALARRTRYERSRNPADLRIIAALCKGYTSEVADALRRDLARESETSGSASEPKAIFLLYNLDDQRISLRKTPACSVDLSRFAGRFGGGGHPAAAGFDLPEAQDVLQGYLVDHLQRALQESL